MCRKWSAEIWFAILILLPLVGGIDSPGRAAEPTPLLEQPKPAQVPQHVPLRGRPGREIRVAFAPECGANSLYVFLQVHGIDASLEACQAEVTVTDRGASLDELAEACRRHGLPVRTLKTTTGGLAHIEFPVIAHLREDAVAESGHFVVLTDRVGESGFAAIDGTTLNLVSFGKDSFAERFSGYCLARENAVAWSGMVEPWLVAVLWLEGAIFVWLVWRWLRLRHGAATN